MVHEVIGLGGANQENHGNVTKVTDPWFETAFVGVCSSHGIKPASVVGAANGVAVPAAGERILIVGDAISFKEFIETKAQEHSVKISIDALPEATDEQIKTYDLVIKKTDVGYQLISAAGTLTATYTSLPEAETAIDKQMGSWA